MPTKQRTVNVPMDSATFDLLTELAQHNDRPKAAEVRHLIRQAANPAAVASWLGQALLDAIEQARRERCEGAPQ